ncbi:MAG TPA: RluA family pseudouridine synthase [Acidimicrobiia bacterium]|nr:RluA family pseudouridine synthase [Acidimicrobiia bacterium]
MNKRLEGTVPDRLRGERADKVVAELAGISREAARRLFDQGVKVDGRAVEARTRLEGGTIDFPAPATAGGTVPEFVDFVVRYEDEHLLVVDKPAGVVVHPGAGHERGTLAAGLVHRYPELEGVGQPGRWGIVHRLDRGTSGLLVVARTQDCYRRLTRQLAEHGIRRSYLALVHGIPEMPTGTIDAPIGRDPAHPTRKRVLPDGRPARTHYRVAGSYGAASLLEVELETGRTHQIRVHLAAIGHPVVGDRTYSRRADPVRLRRMFLHAAALRFTHPMTGAAIDVRSPLPPDLAAPLAELSEQAGTVGR